MLKPLNLWGIFNTQSAMAVKARGIIYYYLKRFFKKLCVSAGVDSLEGVGCPGSGVACCVCWKRSLGPLQKQFSDPLWGSLLIDKLPFGL